MDPIEELLAKLTAEGRFPTKLQAAAAEAVRTWRAFLESNREHLKLVCEWPTDRPYKVDPVGELIADAWADYLLGDPITVGPANAADAAAMELLLENAGDLGGDAHAAARQVIGEGEQWWRIYSDHELAHGPLVTWHSREVVVPFYIGKRLLAAALVTELEPRSRRQSKAVVYRTLEVHADGVVEHLLFRGGPSRLGNSVPLEEHPETAPLVPWLTADQQWRHGLPMLMGRVTNGQRVGRDGLGISEFDKVQDQLLDLNELVTIGSSNARLTAKSRVVVPEDSLEAGPLEHGEDLGDGRFARPAPAATFDAGEDILVQRRSADGGLSDTPARDQFHVLEYSFDATALIAWKADVLETALTRCRLTPQYAGVTTRTDGFAVSGTALRLRLIPQTRAGRGKGRPWDTALTTIVGLMAQVDALPEELNGFGRAWVDPAGEPSVSRGLDLPADPVEDAQTTVAILGAGAESRRTAIKRLHPEWDDPQVDEELARIAEDRPSASAAATFGLT